MEHRRLKACKLAEEHFQQDGLVMMRVLRSEPGKPPRRTLKSILSTVMRWSMAHFLSCGVLRVRTELHGCWSNLIVDTCLDLVKTKLFITKFNAYTVDDANEVAEHGNHLHKLGDLSVLPADFAKRFNIGLLHV